MRKVAAQEMDVDHIRPWHVLPNQWEDLWLEADMDAVIKYLGGCYGLDLPEEWRSSLF